MRKRAPCQSLGLVLALAAVMLLGFSGCGYFKNIRDDFLDCGTLAVGIVTPTLAKDEEAKPAGFVPPALGAYVECTRFLQLGALSKATADLSWDRRGYGVMMDKRTKVGLFTGQVLSLDETPIAANAYKMTGTELDGWRQHMLDMQDSLTDSPAKVMIFQQEKNSEGKAPKTPYFPLGWQDWEMISLELAICEPFILHSGIYVRAGFDFSQVFDLALSLIALDLYGDNAYTLEGDLKY